MKSEIEREENITVLDHAGSAFLRVMVRRMKELGLNQSTLARRMNVSRAYVSRVFQGDVNFTFASALHFAQALQMDFFPELGLRAKKGVGPVAPASAILNVAT